MSKNKIVCYTCITGEYDLLRTPKVINKNIDYICFTDNLQLKSTVWQIKQIPDELQGLNAVKQQRIIKICPHRYLKEYDISIWVDGNVLIIGDLNEFISQYDLNKNSFYVRVHPKRNCVYDEAKECIRLGKDIFNNINLQIEAYQKEGYPRHIGMVETCILLRKHTDIKCQLLCNTWATELLKWSHRDQLSFNYSCWKMHFLTGCLNNEFSLRNNSVIKIVNHNER